MLLTEEEKFRILQSKRIDPKVVEYLMNKLNNLYIEVLGDYISINACWKTYGLVLNESVIVFLNDDYIERSNLYFDGRTLEYYHSWICFNYNEIF